jgi:adenylate kinase family enzyme
VNEILSKFKDQLASSGETVGDIMDRGEIVPARTVISLLEKEIESVKTDKLIIKGFPRTIEQASFLETQNEFSPIVFYVKAKRSLCLHRIISAQDRGERVDDEPEKIKAEQDVFERDTLPAVKYLEGGKIVPVAILDGRKPRDVNAYLIMKNIQALEQSLEISDDLARSK